VKLVFVLLSGRVVPLDRFLTEMFGTDLLQAAGVLNDSLARGHVTFGPYGDDLALHVSDEGEAWLAERGVDPGLIATGDQLDAELRDSEDDDRLRDG
jgi:hypothetical protein